MKEILLSNFIKLLKFNYYHIYKIIENLIFPPRSRITYPGNIYSDTLYNKYNKAVSRNNDGNITPFSFWDRKTEIILLDKTIKSIQELAIYGGENLKYIIVPENLDILSINWSRIVTEGHHVRIKIVHPKKELSIYEITKIQLKMNI